MDQPVFMHEKGGREVHRTDGLAAHSHGRRPGELPRSGSRMPRCTIIHFSIMHSLSSQMNESSRSERQVEDDPDGQHDEPDDGEGDGVRKHIRNDRPHAGVFFITADEA